MLRCESSKARDLIFAVPATAIAATLVFTIAFASGLPEKGKYDLIALSAIGGFLVILPISLVFIVSSYFFLLKVDRLGPIPFSAIGVGGALAIAMLLPVQGSEAYFQFASIGLAAALAGYGTLAYLSTRRTSDAPRLDA